MDIKLTQGARNLLSYVQSVGDRTYLSHDHPEADVRRKHALALEKKGLATFTGEGGMLILTAEGDRFDAT